MFYPIIQKYVLYTDYVPPPPPDKNSIRTAPPLLTSPPKTPYEVM